MTPAEVGRASEGGMTPADRGIAAAIQDDVKRAKKSARTMTWWDGQKVKVTIPEDDREMENALDALTLAAYGALNTGQIPEPFRGKLKAAAEQALRALGAKLMF